MDVNREVVAEFSAPSSQHVYSEPVPKGRVATRIELDDNPGILSDRPRTRLASDDEAHAQSAVQIEFGTNDPQEILDRWASIEVLARPRNLVARRPATFRLRVCN